MKKEVIFGAILALFIIVFTFTVLTADENIAIKLAKRHSSIDSTSETEQLFEYFNHNAEVPEVFDEKEASHLRDVKHVIWGLRIALAILLLTLLLALKFIDISKTFKLGAVICIVIAGLAALAPFDKIFLWMHKLLFSGNWTFPTTSTLIQYYPAAFFNAYYTIAGIIIAVLCTIFFIAGCIMKR